MKVAYSIAVILYNFDTVHVFGEDENFKPGTELIAYMGIIFCTKKNRLRRNLRTDKKVKIFNEAFHKKSTSLHNQSKHRIYTAGAKSTIKSSFLMLLFSASL